MHTPGRKVGETVQEWEARTRTRDDILWKQQQNQLQTDNLRRIGRLSRRGLLVFLDRDSTTRANTSRLRSHARRVAINRDSIDVARDLARAEDCQSVNKAGFLVR